MGNVGVNKEVPALPCSTAALFLNEASWCYLRIDLANQIVDNPGAEVMSLRWLGESANEAIACLFTRRDFLPTPSGPGGGGAVQLLHALSSTPTAMPGCFRSGQYRTQT